VVKDFLTDRSHKTVVELCSVRLDHSVS